MLSLYVSTKSHDIFLADLKRISSATGPEAANSVEKIEGIREKLRRWDDLLHPEQLVRTSLWKSLVAESGKALMVEYLLHVSIIWFDQLI